MIAPSTTVSWASVFHAEADQFVAGLFVDFNSTRFNRTRTDIEPDQLPASFTA